MSPPTRRVSPLSWLGGATRGASVTRLLLSLTLFLVVWQVSATYLIDNRLLLVPATEVAGALYDEIASGEFARHLGTTLLELVIAFPLAVVGGFVIGAVLAGSKPVRQTLDPILTALYSLPIVALAPLFTAGLGFGVASKVAVVILMAIFPVITNTDAGLRSAEPALIETARSYGAGRLQVLRTVTLPHSVPFIISGIRVAFARALVGVIVAEFFGAVAGFGFAIAAAAQSYQTARLLGYVVVLGVVGLVASIGLTALERRIAPWKED
ncbi:NitT/TauT family transport system permease protein [Stackebrandtia albiflava]|uniref:NitT/TauT family transport system permease protein n=1 Tax=Stackebrandtia albiflava TaxID=406432 RepID=A0A562VCF1_9ACTN|nr:ABC transporter permease [Stackebrandtia albiflava]TWJ15528.1 NitT/TauT family transport system permease protein [Stackebrandtia albiflava]